MNETVLDVLMYLFENFAEQEYEHAPDQVELRDELLQAGFGEFEVRRLGFAGGAGSEADFLAAVGHLRRAPGGQSMIAW